MNITLKAFIEDHGQAGWIGWLDGVRGMVVQGLNEDEVRKELILSIKTTIAYSLGLRDLDGISSQKISEDLDVVCVENQNRIPKLESTINLSIA